MFKDEITLHLIKCLLNLTKSSWVDMFSTYYGNSIFSGVLRKVNTLKLRVKRERNMIIETKSKPQTKRLNQNWTHFKATFWS